MSSSHLKGKSDIVGCKCKKTLCFSQGSYAKYFVLVPSTNFIILSYFTWNGATQKKKSLEATFLLLCLQESLLVTLWQQLLHHMQQIRRFKDMYV